MATTYPQTRPAAMLRPGVIAILMAVLLAAWPMCAADAADADRVRIDAITFSGVKALAPEKIIEVMETRLPPSWKIWQANPLLSDAALSRDEEAIQRLYKAKGYYSARVRLKVSRVGRRARLEVQVDEGDPVIISRIILRVAPRDDELKKYLLTMPPDIDFKVGSVFRLEEYIRVKARIIRHLAGRGQPKADLSARVDVSASEGWAAVRFILKPGPHLKMGRAEFKGVKRTRLSILNREVAWKEGQDYDIRLLDETRQRLRKLGIFSTIRIEPDLEAVTDGRVPITVTLTERSTYSVSFGVGYGNEDSFRGRLTGSMRSRLGLAEIISATVHYSGRAQGGLLRYRQKHVLRRNQDLDAQFGIRDREFVSYSTTETYGQVGLERPFIGPIRLSMSYRLEMVSPFDVEVEADRHEENRNYLVSAPSVGLVLDRRDDILNPKSGYVINLRGEAATSFIGSDIDYFLVDSSASQYVTPSRWLTLGFRARVALLSPLWGDSLPIFKRLFSGGGMSVRGFPYQKLGPLDDQGNPTGGQSLLEASIEGRVPLWRELQGVLFLDIGHLAASAWTFEFESVRFTTGVGLRYNTIIGPIRADVGYQLNPPANATFNQLQFHFTIGQAF